MLVAIQEVSLGQEIRWRMDAKGHRKSSKTDALGALGPDLGVFYSFGHGPISRCFFIRQKGCQKSREFRFSGERDPSGEHHLTCYKISGFFGILFFGGTCSRKLSSGLVLQFQT
jgi:hypothetical protein